VRFRGTGGAGEKIELQMTPMIDVVFQLLIFFMLTFKLAVPEGDFYVNMPLVSAAAGQPETDFQQEITVRLRADSTGVLAGVLLNDRPLPGGTPEEMIAALRNEIRGIVALFGPGVPGEGPEVKIDADYHLRYQYTMSAITACSGQRVEVSPGRSEVVRFVEKITFAPPREPAP
jgi:biopolymer transport protein ExbD